MKKEILIALIFLSFTFSGAIAQNSSQSKTTLSIETDPSTFVFKGYAFHFRIKPKNSKHLLLGAGTYALDIPDFLVDLNSDNKSKGWKVRIQGAYSGFGEYYFKEVNRKWFVGFQGGVQEYEIKKSNVAGKEKFNNLLLMGYSGYAYQPFKFPLYLKAWAGLGSASKISGSNDLGNSTYHIAPITWFATFHVGTLSTNQSDGIKIR